ncbi:MAG: hypothetical protein ABL998_09805, partial [Planctomycetota bacterium]
MRFERRCLPKVWGGRALERKPGFALPAGKIGESTPDPAAIWVKSAMCYVLCDSSLMSLNCVDVPELIVCVPP